MKQVYILILLILGFVSCSTDKKHFSFDGRLTNINQGEFYVYALDGASAGLDTIKVETGRFSYEMPCTKPSILMLVFPNFSEQPIFAEPGKSVDVKGDASHLKELEVTGSKTNELMNKFRQQIANASPPEMERYAAQFIADHPESPVGAYLVTKYFIKTPRVNYNKALSLINVLLKAQPEYGYLRLLQGQLKSLATLEKGTLPNFSARDINGKAIDVKALRTAPVAVLYTWATWNYDYNALNSRLNDSYQRANGQLKVIGFNLDASRSDCRRSLESQSIAWPTVNDQQLFNSPTLQLLGLTTVPDNLVLQRGRIVAHGLSIEQLMQKVDELLPKTAP